MSSAPESSDDAMWIRLPHSGWGALVASQAPAHSVRRATPGQPGVAEIDEDIRDYLNAAGIPPDGWLGVWEVRTPGELSESEWWELVLEVQVSPSPRDNVPRLRAVLAELCE